MQVRLVLVVVCTDTGRSTVLPQAIVELPSTARTVAGSGGQTLAVYPEPATLHPLLRRLERHLHCLAHRVYHSSRHPLAVHPILLEGRMLPNIDCLLVCAVVSLDPVSAPFGDEDIFWDAIAGEGGLDLLEDLRPQTAVLFAHCLVYIHRLEPDPYLRNQRPT